MNLEPKQYVLLVLISFFGLVVPFFIKLAADLVRVEDITSWRCIKAGLAGVIGLGLGWEIGMDFHSPILVVILMSLIWMAWIHMALKTTFLKAFSIWFITQGIIVGMVFGLSRFLDLHSVVDRYLASR